MDIRARKEESYKAIMSLYTLDFEPANQEDIEIGPFVPKPAQTVERTRRAPVGTDEKTQRKREKVRTRSRVNVVKEVPQEESPAINRSRQRRKDNLEDIETSSDEDNDVVVKQEEKDQEQEKTQPEPPKRINRSRSRNQIKNTTSSPPPESSASPPSSPQQRKRVIKPDDADGIIDDTPSLEVKDEFKPVQEHESEAKEPKLPPPESQIQIIKPPETQHNYEIVKKQRIVYRVSREEKNVLVNKISVFRLYRLTDLIYSAKYKSGSEIIPIAEGDEVHMKGPMTACVIIGNKYADFCLRSKTKTGPELETIRMYPSTKENPQRSLIVSYFDPKPGAPIRLFSRQPTVMNGKRKTFDFHGSFHRCSVKNAILYDKPSNTDLIFIRKAAKDVIEIDVEVDISPLEVFALCIASFVTTVK